MRGLAETATSVSDSSATGTVVVASVVSLAVTLTLIVAVVALCLRGNQSNGDTQAAPRGKPVDGKQVGDKYIPPNPEPGTKTHEKEMLQLGQPAPEPLEKVALTEATGKALAQLLERACQETRNHVPEHCTMDASSITAGVSTAAAAITNMYGVNTTALFFAQAERCKAHLKAHSRCAPFMPVLHQNERAQPPAYVTDNTSSKPHGVFLFPESDLRTVNKKLVIHLPEHVRMDRVTPARTELRAACEPLPGRDVEKTALPQLYNVILQINKLLRSAHENGLVLRQITLDNIVFAQLELQRGWTLLEFTSAVKAGKKSTTLQALRAPPELASNVQRGEPSEMQPPYDMWQLGMLLYQLATQPWPYKLSYWESIPGLSEQDILKRLVAYSKVDTPAEDRQRERMPHEVKPPPRGPMHEVISNLLAPSDQNRWTFEQLRVYLDINMTPLTQQGQTTSTD